MSFSEQLKQARKSVKLTQEQVAKALGIDKSTYCGYETGKRRPDVERIRELAALFGVHADTLLEVDLSSSRSVSDEEYRLITKYRSLDDSGKGFVEAVLQRECDRCSSAPAPVLTLAAHPGTATPEEVRRTAEEAIAKLKRE